MIDTIISGGTIVDGSGAPRFEGDIAISGGLVTEIGRGLAFEGARSIDARGKLVTPGFVDVHTHYDGHATWASRLNPSSAHGVTTAVMGNCGVGFAPCRPQDRKRLVALMEGVEDIPGVVMEAGLPWDWEHFPDYLDRLDTRRFDMDVCAQLPHAPLRLYVMGERALDKAPATGDDIAAMARLAEQAVCAGAFGFSTSRSLNHRASDGHPTFSLAAAKAELVGIAKAIGGTGRGVLQFISDFDDLDAEFDIVLAMTRESGRPLSLSLMQFAHAPDRWSEILKRIERANRQEGLPIRAQVCARPVGILSGLQLSFHPFSFCPSYAAIASLPLAERLREMRKPELRTRILAEFPGESWQPISKAVAQLDNVFILGARPNYEPSRDSSLAAVAKAQGLSAAEHTYDTLIAGQGAETLYIPAANFVDFTADVMETLLRHEYCVPGLGDGGAHCGTVCDASLTTYMLERWVKADDDRAVPVEEVVRQITADTARLVGLSDRGVLAPGKRADLNIIDLDAVRLGAPRLVHDLPGGHGRLHQDADGYCLTMVAGEITYSAGEPTGALPGRLVRLG